jgi:hypothetical protein
MTDARGAATGACAAPARRPSSSGTLEGLAFPSAAAAVTAALFEAVGLEFRVRATGSTACALDLPAAGACFVVDEVEPSSATVAAALMACPLGRVAAHALLIGMPPLTSGYAVVRTAGAEDSLGLRYSAWCSLRCDEAGGALLLAATDDPDEAVGPDAVLLRLPLPPSGRRAIADAGSWDALATAVATAPLCLRPPSRYYLL